MCGRISLPRHIVLILINASAFYQSKLSSSVSCYMLLLTCIFAVIAVVHFFFDSYFVCKRTRVYSIAPFLLYLCLCCVRLSPVFRYRFGVVFVWRSLHLSSIYCVMAGINISRASYTAPHLCTSFLCSGPSLPIWFVVRILSLILS